MFVAAEPNAVHAFCFETCACNAFPPSLAINEVRGAC